MSKSDKTTLATLLLYTGKTGDYAAARPIWCRLWTVLPDTAGSGGTEVTGGAYAAVDIAADFPTASTGDSSVANTGAVTFPTATADWATGANRVVGFQPVDVFDWYHHVPDGSGVG